MVEPFRSESEFENWFPDPLDYFFGVVHPDTLIEEEVANFVFPSDH